MNNRIMTNQKLCQSLIILMLLLFHSITFHISAQLKGEYFWNQDPGLGKAEQIGSSNYDGEGFSSFDITTDKVPTGINLLGIRVFSGVRWSQTIYRFVFIPSSSTDSECVVEYFWDYDPGIGKAIPITASLDDGGSFTADLSTIGVKPGEHLVGFRACNSGIWSQTLISRVLVTADDQYNLNIAEYFWGEDPGFGNGKSIVLTHGEEYSTADLAIDFPSEKADEYVLNIRARSEKGWGPTFTKVIPHVYVKTIELSSESDCLEVSKTLQVNAIITPTDAFCDEVEWSSSDPNVAIVASDGTVTGISPGKTIITGSAIDGSGTTASIELTVTYLRGDANGNGSLAVNDVVLTARGVVNDYDPAMILEAIDMNGDEELTVGDLTQVVDAVISYSIPSKSTGRKSVLALKTDGIASPLLLNQAGDDISVAFDNDGHFTGIQFDVIGDDGLSVTSVTLNGAAIQSHSAANHRFESGALRMLAYGTESLAANGIFSTIHTESEDMIQHTLTLTNVMASDFNGTLYSLPDCTLSVIHTASIESATVGNLCITVEGRTVIITSGVETTAVITDMKGITTSLEIPAGVTRYTLPVAGIYVVNNQKIIIR